MVTVRYTDIHCPNIEYMELIVFALVPTLLNRPQAIARTKNSLSEILLHKDKVSFRYEAKLNSVASRKPNVLVLI